MESALVAGLVAGGAGEVHVFGLATTPCMFYSIVKDGYAGAIMITASHMPWNANGGCAHPTYQLLWAILACF